MKVWGFLGRFRPEPFGPGRFLGFHSKPRGFSWFPDRIPTEISRLRWIPDPGSLESIAASRVPSRPDPKTGSTGSSKKLGSAFASRFFFNHPFRPLPLNIVLANDAASAVVVAPRTAPLPERRSSAAKVLSDSPFRVAPNGIFRVSAVDYVNPGDKSARLGPVFRPGRQSMVQAGRAK